MDGSNVHTAVATVETTSLATLTEFLSFTLVVISADNELYGTAIIVDTVL
jgi:hypothetical protein